MSLLTANETDSMTTDGGRPSSPATGRFQLRRRHVITWAVVAVALFLAGFALGESDSVGAAEADGVLEGPSLAPSADSDGDRGAPE